MQFEFYPLRFEFTARESIYFPPGKSANVLRGALGLVFRKIACVPECRQASVCEIRDSCPYARVFEPASPGEGPSGLADWPRPFVFRARHLDGSTVQPGQPFHFDLHVFTVDPDVLAYFVLTFAAIAREGLGPNRGKCEMLRVRRIAVGEMPEQVLYDGATQMMSRSVDPVALDLSGPPAAAQRLRVEFLSPTELKHEDRITNRPEVPILFGRIRDRISTLRKLYGPGPLDIDFQESNARAAAVRMTNCALRRVEFERRSSRTGQHHAIGGFIGFAEYEGDLAEFQPYLEIGKWTGVGRQATFGKGEIETFIE